MLAQGWLVVRSRKRTGRIGSHSTTIPIPFIYWVLKKRNEGMTPLKEWAKCNAYQGLFDLCDTHHHGLMRNLNVL